MNTATIIWIVGVVLAIALVIALVKAASGLLKLLLAAGTLFVLGGGSLAAINPADWEWLRPLSAYMQAGLPWVQQTAQEILENAPKNLPSLPGLTDK